MLRWLLAALHLLALPLGLGAVWTRSRALADVRDRAGLRRVFAADSLWGLSAAVWIGTGVWRAFGALEKGAAYYLQNRIFWVKMGLLVLILLLEAWPMATLIRWRVQTARNQNVDTTFAPAFATISRVQAGVVVLMVFAATAMARGLFR